MLRKLFFAIILLLLIGGNKSMAEIIQRTDTLNQGREKINNSILQAGHAFSASDNAVNIANEALTNSLNTQEQLNQIIIEGDSSVEAAQARVSADGITYDTLKARLDSEIGDRSKLQGEPSIDLVGAINKNTLQLNAIPTKNAKQLRYRSYGYNIDVALAKYKYSLSNHASNKITIDCIGDSVTRGEYASDEANKSWVGVLRTLMQNKYGNVGEGFINILESSYPAAANPRWALGSGWGVMVSSGFGASFASSAGNMSPTALSFNGTKVKLLYARTTDGGEATVKIDGNIVGTINCHNDAIDFTQFAIYEGLALGDHVMTITPNTTSGVFVTGAFVNNDNTAGVEVNRIAVSGTKTSDWVNVNIQASWSSLPAPDLVVLAFGLNDAVYTSGTDIATFKANMGSLITYWKDRGSAVCLISYYKPNDPWTSEWESYVAAMYEMADTYNTGLIDIYKAYFKHYTLAQSMGLFGLSANDYSGGSGTNDAHPGDKGYNYIGNILFENLYDNFEF